ncbi:MAG: FecR protein [Planctomycetota bacterium]|jgi:ferric-dicitrate binding protein FerR (iron transport regulator)
MTPADPRTAFARWLDGDLEAADEAALAAALSADPALRAACAGEARLAAALAALHSAGRGEAVAAMVVGHLRARSARTAARSARDAVRRVRRPWPVGWLVAAAVLAVLVGMVLARPDAAGPEPADMAAASAPAPERRLDLPGGGTVLAAAGSALVRDGDGWRLEQGRVEVSADPRSGSGAVVVRTPEAACRVLGTRFSVVRASGSTAVAVAHGVVAVEGRNGTVVVPAGGRATATADAITAALVWDRGDHAPAWLAIGAAGPDGIRAQRFPDAFATLGIDLKPLRLPLRGGTAIDLRARLGGDAPTLELWCRTTDGRAWVWEEVRPPLDAVIDRRVPFAAFRDDGTRTTAPPPGAMVDWLHASTRAGSGRSLLVERLAVTGWGVPAAP